MLAQPPFDVQVLSPGMAVAVKFGDCNWLGFGVWATRPQPHQVPGRPSDLTRPLSASQDAVEPGGPGRDHRLAKVGVAGSNPVVRSNQVVQNGLSTTAT